MIEIHNPTLLLADCVALDTAIKAAVSDPTKCYGSRSNGEPVTAFLKDDTSPADQAAAQGALTAHDPVFLSVDKATIAADGVTPATITVTTVKAVPAAVTLLVAGTPVPVTLVAGVGTVTVTSIDALTIAVSVQTPANRSSQTLTIEAV